jgi:hypothetical protein
VNSRCPRRGLVRPSQPRLTRMGDLPRSPDDTRCPPRNGAGVAHAGQTRHTAPRRRLKAHSSQLTASRALCHPHVACAVRDAIRSAPLADDWPLLVTRRRRLHNAAHHEDRGHQNTFRSRTRPALVAGIAGSGRLPRPRCAPAPPRVARMQRPDPLPGPPRPGFACHDGLRRTVPPAAPTKSSHTRSPGLPAASGPPALAEIEYRLA